MFKKPEPEEIRTEPMIRSSEPTPLSTSRSRAPATIGPSIHINGDVSGNEDVIIEGRVDGTISLKENVLTVGKEGQINATVNARAVFVEGKVEGDLTGGEQIVIRRSGNVRGNIVAPRVTLEDGCRFKGSVDMDVEPVTASRGNSARSDKVADIKSAAGSGGDSSSGDGVAETPSQ